MIDDGRIKGRFHAIPLSLWACIIGFHRKISIEHDAESVSYHRWCEKEKRYHSMIPYQGSDAGGLRIHFTWKDPRNVKLLDEYAKKYGEEFLPASTIHTHVDAGSFESGVDAGDEYHQPGWHITLGKLISYKEYDFDFRIRLPRLPRVKRVVDTEEAYEIDHKPLFAEGITLKELATIPGTTDWHHLADRVEIKSYKFPKPCQSSSGKTNTASSKEK